MYEVRRACPARKLDKGGPSVPDNWDRYAKGQGARSLRTLSVGTYADTRAAILAVGGQPAGEHQFVRAWSHRAGPPYPSREEFLVAAPAGVPNKVGPAFPTVWAHARDTPREELPDPWPLVFSDRQPA